MMTAEIDAQENLGKESNWFEKHLKRIHNYQLVGHLTCWKFHANQSTEF